MSAIPSPNRPRAALETVDPVWARLRLDAEEAARAEPPLAGLLFAAVLNQDSIARMFAAPTGAVLHFRPHHPPGDSRRPATIPTAPPAY